MIYTIIIIFQIPEFDNLYLDMNGIIHNCSHPNDDDVHFRISEEKMMADIFHYLEVRIFNHSNKTYLKLNFHVGFQVLFRLIRPQKVFFMAIDGVAPRAKMNQQRGRRFRSAKEAEDKEKEALRKVGMKYYMLLLCIINHNFGNLGRSAARRAKI